MSRRFVTTAGLVAAGGVGYYLYQAGGEPKAARKEFEHDVVNAKSALKGEHISAEAAKKQGEAWAAKAGAKLDGVADDVRGKIREADAAITRKAGQAESKLDQLKHDSAASFESTRRQAGRTVDQVDSKVETKAKEAKSGISSWLGFK